MSEHKCMQCIHGSVCDDFEGSHSKDCEFFEPENKWISVNDRLPEDYIKVLACDAKGNVHTMSHYRGYAFPFGIDKHHLTYHPVTHWMPLPQPPEDKEKEGAIIARL